MITEFNLPAGAGKVDVLIVDDRVDGLIALEATLSASHLNIVKARSGREAIGLLTEYDFAVILLDVQMPHMDGFETARFIRKTEKYQATPIIFVTAINKDDGYIYEGYSAGAVDYIFKPFDPYVVKSKVNIFVDLFLKSNQLKAQAEMIREIEKRERVLRLAELEVESLKRYRNLADAIPHVVWKAKPDGVFDYFNKVWTDYSGLSLDESAGSGWQQAIHPDDMNKFLKTWIHSMTANVNFETEARVRRKDGEWRWYLIRGMMELGHKQEIIAWLGTCTDIHDRKLAEVKLKTAEEAANAANMTKTHFLANMSHEIRTPLTSILGFTELLFDPKQSEEEKHQSVSAIRRSGRQLLKIIDDVLDISKIEAGHLEVEIIKLDLLSLLKEVRSAMSIQAQTKNLRLHFNVKSKVPVFVYSDPTRLRQILMNVINNAIKFTFSGDINVEINWSESVDSSSSLQIRVTDTGVGINPMKAQKLFQPFVQVDTSTTRKFGGTGLGLALSRQLAKALDGDVILERSREGFGSTFLIEMKCQSLMGAPYFENLNATGKDDLKPYRDGEKLLEGVPVLLVDDARENQMIVGSFLTSAGARVDIASDGKEGVEKALAKNYQVILMDIQMPYMDGYEAVAQLRASGYTKPIIALTAHALKEERDRCLRAGCNDHLTKPIDRSVLVDRVARMVRENPQLSPPLKFESHSESASL